MGRESVLFIDDTVLVDDSAEKLKRSVPQFGKVYQKRKLKINLGKSDMMKCSASERQGSFRVRLNKKKRLWRGRISST